MRVLYFATKFFTFSRLNEHTSHHNFKDVSSLMCDCNCVISRAAIFHKNKDKNSIYLACLRMISLTNTKTMLIRKTSSYNNLINTTTRFERPLIYIRFFISCYFLSFYTYKCFICKSFFLFLSLYIYNICRK